MFEIDNYRITFSKDRFSIYFQLYDKSNFIFYTKKIDLIVLSEEIKYVPTLDDLFSIFNKIFSDLPENISINIIDYKKARIDIKIKQPLLNINISFELDEEDKKENHEIAILKEQIYTLEKKIKKLKMGKSYTANFSIIVGQNYVINGVSIKINNSNKYFYICYDAENKINEYEKLYLISDKYIKMILNKPTHDSSNHEIRGDIGKIVKGNFNLNKKINHLIIHNFYPENHYNNYDTYDIKTLEFIIDKSYNLPKEIEEFKQNIYLINKHFKKGNIVYKLILRNMDTTQLTPKKWTIETLKEIEIYDGIISDDLKTYCKVGKIKLNGELLE